METERKTTVVAMKREGSDFVFCIIALRVEINFMSVVPCVCDRRKCVCGRVKQSLSVCR